MEYELAVQNGNVHIGLPYKNKGKYRWKTRKSINEFGNVFSTVKISYTEHSYLEWQIGYDVEKNNLKKGKKTKLKKFSFKGGQNNKKTKHPYELSEILYEMYNASLIDDGDLLALKSSVAKTTYFFDEKHLIKKDIIASDQIEHVDFVKQTVSLPTFVYMHSKNGLAIEISIQKQQHASGVQPMLYMCIPVICLENGDNLIGKTSKSRKKEEHATLVIDQNNKDYILKAFKLFSMCSKRHKKDVNKILTAINKQIAYDKKQALKKGSKLN